MSKPCAEAPRALLLAPELPALGVGGGPLRTESLRQYLARNYEVDVVTLRLRKFSKSMPARALRNVARLVRGVPPLFDRYSGYEAQLRASLAHTHYDVAVVEHFWCASYAPLLRPLCDRLVLDLHNIESALAATHTQAAHGTERWLSRRFANMYAALEKQSLPAFDTLLVTSDADRARVNHPDVRIYPNAVPAVPLPTVAEHGVVAFSGNLEYHPNIEAVRWFAREVWPRIAVGEWHLIGRNAHAIESIVRDVKRVRIIGPVDDAVGSLAASRICVVPLLSGSGTRFKIIEAWAAGRAVVSTTIGAEGLPARAGEHLLLADTPEDFAEAVLRLWNDADARTQLGRAGRALYESRLTWDAAWNELDLQGGL
jgi:polysaccharide biosynthesis protein PslH